MSLRAPVRLYDYRGHVQTTAPAVEPVTADELRDHLRETATGLPDGEANTFIAEAREYIEEMTGLAIITQVWKLALDQWPHNRQDWWDGVRQGSITQLYGPDNAADLHMPRHPLQAVDAVTVYSEDGTPSSVTVADVFDVDTYQKPGRMTLQRGATWPVALRSNNAIEIDYTAGYGDAATDVPAPIKGAVKRMAASLYAHRGDGCSMADAYNSSGAARMVSVYPVRSI